MLACVSRRVLTVATQRAIQYSHNHVIKANSQRFAIPYFKQDPDEDRYGYYQHPEEDLTKLPGYHKMQFNEYRSDLMSLKEGVWPWNTGVRSRLPDHYKQRYVERYSRQPRPVHYQPDERKWKQDKHGVWKRVENVPIPIFFPRQADQGLWGGEGLIVGMRKKHNKMIKPRTPRIWKPRLTRRVFYSEILDEYLVINVTLRMLDLVDEARGFDHYILATHEVDLRSRLGMALKRRMLSMLSELAVSAGDPARRDELYGCYEKYMVPEEEIEWIGLSLDEAVKKQEALEAEAKERSIHPLKDILAVELIERLRNPPPEDEEVAPKATGWMSKLNPFKDS